MSTFARFAPRLQEAIVARLGWTCLRPVQEEAGAVLLDGHNAVILAPTAGGKTEAAMFPLLSTLLDDQPDGVGILYIAPIKALLNNQEDRLGLYTEMIGLHRVVWHGDVGDSRRKRFLSEPAELLMTTPESLEVMLVSKKVDSAALFGDVRAVVIDEVHALAGTDRGAHLMSVLERISGLSRHDVQRIGLSATVGNPEAILEWLRGTSSRNGFVVDPPRDRARRELLIVHRSSLPELADDAARFVSGRKTFLFCQSRAATEAFAQGIHRTGTAVFVHHSAVSREERMLAEERFQRGSDACIVCTSTLELGIDVGDLDRVLQAEAPPTVSSFLQRMGRTGRREGQAANTIFLCETSEGVLQAIALIELAKSGWVENISVSNRCWPVLIHQLLALSLAGDGVTAEDAWAQLSRVPDFQGIARTEFDCLITELVQDQALRLGSGRLVLGPKAEKQFGRRNFMELFTVFSSPETYTVQGPGGQVVGTLQQDFVDRLVEGVSSFLLAGRPWVAIRVQHEDRRILVEPGPRGREPRWGGYVPQFLSFEVSQQILAVLCSEDPYPYLSPGAADVLHERRTALQDVLVPQLGGFEYADGEATWWTFAGGKINATLRYAFAAVNDRLHVITDNFRIRVRGEGMDRIVLGNAISRVREPGFWDDEGLWEDVTRSLPGYRLSKFQPLMPTWVEQELLREYLLDVRTAGEWLSRCYPRLESDVR